MADDKNKKQVKLMNLDHTIGLPPLSHLSDNIIKNAFPVVKIVPCAPSIQTDINIFKLASAFSTPVESTPAYTSLVAAHGYNITSKEGLYVAFTIDNLPSEVITNEYGESFLQKFTDVASDSVSDIVQMSGGRTATESVKEFGNLVGSYKGLVGQTGQFVSQSMTDLQEFIGKAKGSTGAGGFVARAANTADKLLAGQRVDFPMVWKNSAFQQNYSITVRLYNPNLANDSAHKFYISGPLTALVCLATPISDKDGKSFFWPYFHKFVCPGMFNIETGMITSMSITKGGDSMSVGYNQRFGVVDVRIEFSSLYSTLMASENQSLSSDVPTVTKYISAINTYKKVKTVHSKPDSVSITRNIASRTDNNRMTQQPTPNVQTNQKNTGYDIRERPIVSGENESPEVMSGPQEGYVQGTDEYPTVETGPNPNADNVPGARRQGTNIQQMTQQPSTPATIAPGSTGTVITPSDASNQNIMLPPSTGEYADMGEDMNPDATTAQEIAEENKAHALENGMPSNF